MKFARVLMFKGALLLRSMLRSEFEFSKKSNNTSWMKKHFHLLWSGKCLLSSSQCTPVLDTSLTNINPLRSPPGCYFKASGTINSFRHDHFQVHYVWQPFCQSIPSPHSNVIEENRGTYFLWFVRYLICDTSAVRKQRIGMAATDTLVEQLDNSQPALPPSLWAENKNPQKADT